MGKYEKLAGLVAVPFGFIIGTKVRQRFPRFLHGEYLICTFLVAASALSMRTIINENLKNINLEEWSLNLFWGLILLHAVEPTITEMPLASSVFCYILCSFFSFPLLIIFYFIKCIILPYQTALAGGIQMMLSSITKIFCSGDGGCFSSYRHWAQTTYRFAIRMPSSLWHYLAE
jgi:hypothetical protein